MDRRDFLLKGLLREIMKFQIEMERSYNLEEEKALLSSVESNIILAYPMDLLVGMAEKKGIDVEGKDRLQLAKEILSHEERESVAGDETRDAQFLLSGPG